MKSKKISFIQCDKFFFLWEITGYGQLLKNKILRFVAEMLKKKSEVHLVLHN